MLRGVKDTQHHIWCYINLKTDTHQGKYRRDIFPRDVSEKKICTRYYMRGALLHVVKRSHVYIVECNDHRVVSVICSGLYSTCSCPIRTWHVIEVWDDELCKSRDFKGVPYAARNLLNQSLLCMVVFWEEGPEAQKTARKVAWHTKSSQTLSSYL